MNASYFLIIFLLIRGILIRQDLSFNEVLINFDKFQVLNVTFHPFIQTLKHLFKLWNFQKTEKLRN